MSPLAAHQTTYIGHMQFSAQVRQAVVSSREQLAAVQQQLSALGAAIDLSSEKMLASVTDALQQHGDATRARVEHLQRSLSEMQADHRSMCITSL